MITLPTPRRAHLRAFWLIQSAYAALLATIVCGLLRGRQTMLFGIAGGIVIALYGFWRPRAVAVPYRLWERFTESFAKVARGYVLKICYYVVFTVVGRAGSSLQRDSKSESLWVPRTSLPASTYGSQYNVAIPSFSHWPSSYLGWAYSSGHLWAWALLPFLMLVAALDTEESKTYPVAIYTLF